MGIKGVASPQYMGIKALLVPDITGIKHDWKSPTSGYQSSYWWRDPASMKVSKRLIPPPSGGASLYTQTRQYNDVTGQVCCNTGWQCVPFEVLFT